ncbi:MAG: hypothetical protein HYV32_02930 [Candidatus Kerfeldbacteria bacterium]|nr:hypothetical protein [Candidatus Kerfeldbacteria bacterium]
MHTTSRLRILFLSLVATALWLPQGAFATFGDVSTYLSRPYYGDGKDTLEALFDFPDDIDVTDGGMFVIADTMNNVVRKIETDGIVETVAGTGSTGDNIGAADTAEFFQPRGVDIANGAVYVADTGNNKIKKIEDDTVSTLVSDLNAPEAVRVYGNTVYFLDTGNNALKKVSVNGGSVTTITSSLNDPVKLDITPDGTYAYIANAGTYQIKRVNLSSGAVATIAGTGNKGDKNGSCTEATFNQVWGIHVYDDNTLFVSDGDGFSDGVREIDLTGCTVSVFASDTNMVSINFPKGLTTYDGQLYVVATGIGIIQQYDLADPNVNSKFAGADRFNVKNRKPVLVGNPKFMVLSKNKKTIYFSENNRIRSVRRGDLHKSKLIAGSVIDNYVEGEDTEVRVGDQARFSDITSFALTKDGERLIVVDRNNNRLRQVNIATKEVSYLTGAGQVNLRGSETNDFANGDACPNEYDTDVSGCAYFNRPMGIVISKDGKYAYVTDSGNNRIRTVVLRGENKGKVTTLAGSGSAGFTDGVGTAASFNAPIGMMRSKSGNSLFVADRDNHAIRRIKIATGEVTTYAGTGSAGNLDATIDKAVFSYPEWLTRGAGGRIYISEVGSNTIRMIDRKLGVTKLVAGSGTRGYFDGSQQVAEFNNPKGMLALGDKRLLVAELNNDTIRAINVNGEAPFTDPAPVVSEAEPASIAKEWFSDDDKAQIEIHGTNFRNGAVAYIGSYTAVKTYIQSSTSLVAELPIDEMPAGYYTIRVENSDGQYDDQLRALAISQNGSVPVTDYYPQ